MDEKLPIMAKLGVIFLTWRRYQQRDLLSHKITLKQLYVLRQLDRREFLNPSQIADMLFCDRPTATVVIKNMEKQGWVRKEKDGENSRQIKVTLTAEGRRKLLLLEKKPSAGDAGFDPLECFTGEEKVQFDLLLNKLGKHLSRIDNS